MSSFLLNRHKNGVRFLSIPQWDNSKLIKTAFTTRIGGVSSGKYESLNLGERTEDCKRNIEINYSKLCEALELEDIPLVSLKQTHSDKIVEVKKENLPNKKGYMNLGEGDALVTDDPGVALMTFHADCIPVFIFDSKSKAIGLVHSGWKGTVESISVKTFYKMQALYKSRQQDLQICIGPGIGYCCFEIGEDVYALFKEKFFYLEKYAKKTSNEKYHIDLKGLIKRQLEDEGIKNILISQECTVCRKDLFFSHRRDKGSTGRMAAVMRLI